ncbi:hypothetical protein BU24DRAFT_422699 [Aaosphaeria arxii CBS 175.79]|uniref:Adipose-regulatory protein-domain-containing protein n=1 Tax=Aaosphaeria arxii CBS 175.79 TaxID=1450172 RepID=A0A6A5XSR8_9PLEO|nr:uncharacterized protein BU24DRAFT_422699 [Aaosphaeria arxii CBS 175.79]KAF2016348.1 hypothetical protein BU24DRAFT_422699 [Aaosphaeria arxii CBS 175.79]
MGQSDEGYRSRWPLVAYATDAVLTPFYIATSPAFLRTYLRTALVLLTSFVLFGVAVLAYTTFYFSYIPVRGVTVPVYLQYDLRTTPALHHVNRNFKTYMPSTNLVIKFPYGIANVAGLVSRQKYDVSVEMVLPRSERNLDAGNWMLGLEMRAPVTVGGGVKQMLGYGEEWDVDDFSEGGEAGTAKEGVSGGQGSPATDGLGNVGKEKAVVLARSRRPGILTYRSWITELAWRIARMPIYVIGWGDEREKVVVGMMEGVEFDKGWRNIPASVRLEVRSKTPLEVYNVAVKVSARLEGMRWVMFHYKLTSLVVFTGLFWSVEMGILLMTWGLFSIMFGGRHEDETSNHRIKKEKRIKLEGGDEGTVTPKTDDSSTPSTPLSDTSRTFPTLPSQQPLQYSSPSESTSRKIKEEDRGTPALDDIPTRATGAEADDEEEDDDFLLEEPISPSAAAALTDSGIGTSMESAREGDKGLVRRRSGKREK